MNFSIRKTLVLISSIYALVAITIIICTVKMLASADEHDELTDKRFQSLNLAAELKQSSDDLTRFVRTYAATGNQIYEEYFNAIVAIRDSEKPHPKDFNLSYWDRVSDGLIQPAYDGELYSIEGRMVEIGLSEGEIEALVRSKNESDALIDLENIAFNAVKGIYKGQDGQFSVTGEPDHTMAVSILHGKEYHAAKSRIMNPIEEFIVMLRQRYTHEFHALNERTNTLLSVIYGHL
jgi:methyl-accepting chemotaxis protein